MPEDSFRIYLRALELADAETTCRWRNDETYLRGVESMKRYISLETEKRWVEQAIRDHEALRAARFGIVLKESDELIGLVHLSKIDMVNRQADVGYFIGEDRHRGQRYANEACFLLFEYGFLELGLQCISSRILETNTASIRSAERFGFVKEGVLRRRIYKEGAYRNLIACSMLREEFMEKRAKIRGESAA